MFNTRIKILIGYGLLATVLLSATWMAYDNTRSLSEIDRASEKLMARRDIVDSLVYSMLETANAERSILLGDTDEWMRFETALNNSVGKTLRLRPMIADTIKQQRLDTLVSLLNAKRENTLLVMEELGKNVGETYYTQKMRALQNGADSVIIHPQTRERHERHETVYEVVKSRRGFFRRLGDAFRRQHTDTVSTTYIAGHPDTDTVRHSVNIAGSVAGALAEIRHDQQAANNRVQDISTGRNQRLQRVSIQIARRTGLLLEDIQTDELAALRQAIDNAASSRRDMVKKIAISGLLAIISAAILLIYTLRDIKRERRDHERIAEAKAETERIMQQRERLLLTITHDIKAPAASIAGFIDLLGEYVSHPKGNGYLRNIASSAKHLQQLVSALLDYHRLENGNAELHYVSFAPATLVRECVDAVLPQARTKRLDVKTDIRIDDAIMCRSDAFRIKQIVNNLLGNAIKYTDKGMVTVAVAVAGGRMGISVTDTGCGMNSEEQQRIFNAFTRLSSAGGKEGVGLGLAITREIVQRLGGNIRVVSQKGKGSKFTVNIPMEIVGTQATVDNNMAAATATGDTSGITVLIVDDDRLQLQLLTEMLDHIDGTDFKITAISRACEAVNTAHEISPHIVFTDIEMPEMGGSEILRLLRGNTSGDKKECKPTKFVAMTAHERDIMPQLRKEGFDACLFKPFSIQTLAATICQLTGIKTTPRTTGHKTDSYGQEIIHKAISQFTEGDPDAERQIVDSIQKSIDEYLTLLGDPTDTALTAKAAHKAMPLLEMLLPGKNEWLTPLTPEHIAETSAQQRATLVKQLTATLKHIKTSMISWQK